MIFNINRLFLRAVLARWQNGTEGTEISHIPSTPTYVQHAPPSNAESRGEHLL